MSSFTNAFVEEAERIVIVSGNPDSAPCEIWGPHLDEVDKSPIAVQNRHDRLVRALRTVGFDMNERTLDSALASVDRVFLDAVALEDVNS